MNQQQRNSFYPTISYNSESRCESRWNKCANAYGDISDEWKISIGNGKRLYRQWNKCNGVKDVKNQYGVWLQILNDGYLLKPPEIKRQTAWTYDMAMQPDGDENFFTSQQRISSH
jgi:hypothetical protein